MNTRHATAPLVLRLITGFGLMNHGFAKLARGPDAFASVLSGMHVPAPALFAWLTIATELVGGVAVLAGAVIWLVSLPIAAVLLVAMATVHWPFGFSSIKLLAFTEAGPRFGPPGYELDLFYLACLSALVLAGPGPWSIDRALARTRRARSHEVLNQDH